MSGKEEELKEYFKIYPLPWQGDGEGMYILDANAHMVAQIRGWGYLTGQGGLKLTDDKAIAVQDLSQEVILEAVNGLAERDKRIEKLEEENGRLEQQLVLFCNLAESSISGKLLPLHPELETVYKKSMKLVKR